MLLWFTALQTVLLLFINIKGKCVFIATIESACCSPSMTVQVWVCTKICSLMCHFLMILLFQRKKGCGKLMFQLPSYKRRKKCLLILRCLTWVCVLLNAAMYCDFFLCYAPCHIRAIVSWSFGLNQKNTNKAGIIFQFLIFPSEITL